MSNTKCKPFHWSFVLTTYYLYWLRTVWSLRVSMTKCKPFHWSFVLTAYNWGKVICYIDCIMFEWLIVNNFLDYLLWLPFTLVKKSVILIAWCLKPSHSLVNYKQVPGLFVITIFYIWKSICFTDRILSEALTVSGSLWLLSRIYCYDYLLILSCDP